MKKSTRFMIILGLLLVLLIPAAAVFAQSATAQAWTSAIQYQNPGSDAGNLIVTFYDTSGGATSTDPINIAGYSSGTLLVGTVNGLSASFEGSAVLSSNVPVVAVHRSIVEGAEEANYDFILTNGYGSGDAGTTVYIATVLKGAFGATSRFGIQNLDTVATDVQIDFYAAGASTPTHTITPTIQAQSSYIASMSDYADGDIPAGFSGSLVAHSVNNTSALVATSEETWDSGRQAYGFEGVSEGASKLYIPTMLSYYNGGNVSYYAFQAVGGDVEITMKHYDRDTGAQLGSTYVTNITDGAKVSLNPNQHGTVPNGSIGSSIVEVTGGTGGIIGIVKVYDGTTKLLTSYTAESAYAVASEVSLGLPYVVHEGWNLGDLQTYIAVQNIGGSNATDVKALFYDSSGTLVKTVVLADGGNPLLPLQKANTGGHAAASTFTGSVIITSDQPVSVASRVYKGVDLDAGATLAFSEDYTGTIFSNP